jgi:hypothetical protein
MRRLGLLFVLALLGCSDRTGEGDPSGTPNANPLGPGLRVHEVQDPANGNAGKTVETTAVTVLAVDQFDETGDGKSRGTIFVQDLGSTEPLSGISLFSAVLVPASLRLAPGDVVDLRGRYDEVAALGTFAFKDGAFLPQLVQPTTKFRFEGPLPAPVEIDLDDLAHFDRGRKWISMLVTVKDVFAASAVVVDPPSGRAGVTLAKSLPGTGLTTEPTFTNELIPLPKEIVKKGAKLKSVTGIVTFFANLHIAPRSAADVVVEP